MKLNNKGQSLVETALVLPIIVLLLMGMIEFSRVFGSYLLITHAAREGARIAAIGRNDDEILLSVQKKAGILNLEDVQVLITPPDYDRRTGQDVEVRVKYKLTIYAPVIQSMMPNPFSMETSTFMRVE